MCESKTESRNAMTAIQDLPKKKKWAFKSYSLTSLILTDMSKKKLKKQTNLELPEKARKINSDMTRNSSKLICIKFENNRTFYHDVTAVILVFANKRICLF